MEGGCGLGAGWGCGIRVKWSELESGYSKGEWGRERGKEGECSVVLYLEVLGR